MNNVDSKELDKRMQRIESDLAEIKSALLGNVTDGSPGILGRVRERENQAENHDLRLVSLEQQARLFVRQKDLDLLERRVEENRHQLAEWKAQMRLLSWMAGGGGLGGAVALVWTLIQAFAGG